MDLAIMYDILAEIALHSESLQNRNMTVAYADILISYFIENLKISAINPQQLLTSVTNNLKLRLFTTIPSNEPKSTSGSLHTNSKQEEYDTLLKELKVLERDEWRSEKPPGFREIEIEHLCRRFKLTASKIKNGSRVSIELTLLFNCIKLIPCSSAECEREFRQINLIISPT
ncbi:hypothetical protein PR048_021564 [Dryococelus australis]|uniref:HAT C-terminal dimerisation domain-containing protein n=1 Tax=Dryococelus australis TaxID=614101 RepID=A0ABQ9GYJ0_9NEOP|nr:hypothetical protein PR048_021564 [Dryococelus australis]